MSSKSSPDLSAPPTCIAKRGRRICRNPLSNDGAGVLCDQHLTLLRGDWAFTGLEKRLEEAIRLVRQTANDLSERLSQAHHVRAFNQRFSDLESRLSKT